jgi:23S rRNA pseudouridine1911/1915/1917 synthase
VIADRGDDRRRLDRVVLRHLADVPGISRTRVQAWVDEGRVHIGGVVARRAAQRVMAGVEVRVTMAPPRGGEDEAARPDEEVRLSVLYEDEHLLAVDKPAGLIVHPSYGHRHGTLMHALIRRAATWPTGRPSLVHRLDKWTSGVLLVAKSREVHAAAARALASPASSKEYLALCYGRLRAPTRRLRYPLGRDPRDRRRVIVREDGRDAVTEVTRLATSSGAARGLTLVCCRLLTGRMHQVRVHLQAAGLPVVGDPVYGEDGWRRIRDAALAVRLRAASRQMLHAWRLSLAHPMTGAPLRVEAPPPEDLATLVAAAGADRAIAARRQALPSAR